MSENDNIYEEALQARLENVASSRSQAEIARLTNTQRTNVNRYLKGRRVPATFCMALVDKLGINPAWLLAGEGTQLLADTAKSTEYLAGDMLELVQAMNVASRMRLGALSSKDNLKVLRQLNDGLERYQELKESIGKRAGPIIRDLLRSFEHAVLHSDFDAAPHKIEAIESIIEFCIDDSLVLEFDELKVNYYYSTGNSSKARELLRRLYLHYLPRSREYSDAFFRCAIRLTTLLFGEGRFLEALGILRSAVALADTQKVGNEIAARFPGWEALLNYELGDVRASLRALDQASEQDIRVQRKRPLYGLMLFITGRISVNAAWEAAIQGLDTGMELLRYATFAEDKNLLKQFLPTLEKTVASEHPYTIHARRVLRLLKKDTSAGKNAKGSTSPKRIPDAPSQDGPLKVNTIVDDAHYYRLSGNIEEACAQTLEAQKLIESMAPDAQPYLWARSIHYRNILELAAAKAKAFPAGLKKEARAFFETHQANGYTCFQDLCQKLLDS